MFERFSKEARAVVVLAQEEARRLRHPFIGTEHLLLALLEEGEGPAAQALKDHGLTTAALRRRILDFTGQGGDDLDSDALATLGIDLDAVRRATEASFGPGALDSRSRKPMKSGHIPFSKRAKKVLELSLREALRLGHDHIGTGHVLLGLIREGDGCAPQILIATGVDLPTLRDQVTRLISAEAA